MKLAPSANPVATASLPGSRSREDLNAQILSGELLAVESIGDKVTLCNSDGSIAHLHESGPQLGFLEKFKGSMLPSNLSTAVSKDYVASRKWHAVHDFANSITSYMGTAAALGAVGIGSGPLTVGMAWMLRDAVDGVGKLAGSVHAKNADRDPKGMYFKGETIQTAGQLLESTLSVVPGAFLGIATSAQVVKALGASYRGAAEPIIDAHQALNHNLAEVKAKNNNQDMLVNTIGGAVAFGLDQLVRNTVGPYGLPLVTAGAGALKIWASKQYVDSLDINFVTEKAVFRRVAEDLQLKPSGSNGLKDARELDLGQPIDKITAEPERFVQLVGISGNDRYLLDLKGEEINVYLHQDSSPQDQVRATYQAGLLTALVHGQAFQSKVAELGQAGAELWAIEKSRKALPSEQEILKNVELADLRLKVGPSRALWKMGEAPGPPSISKPEFAQLCR